MADSLSGGGRSARLLAAAGDDLAAAARVRLLTELTAGSVDPEVYARYLRVEEEFVHTAARVLGAAVWDAPRWESTVGHARSLFSLVTEQREYFAHARAQWPAAADLSPAARRAAGGLSEHVLRAAADHGYPAIVTSMLAAEQLYLTWCTAATGRDVRREPAVQEWIELHARAPFTDQVAFLRAEVDALPGEVSDARLLDWFTAMLAEECRFHDAVFR
ncbi:thiaminase/transcriptional activator TenA [Lipingzhangella halophila]|uniref:Aminopyrimidine aminohydrolase n=1 Tax=Lipingzhangella halophila TaxID=1783352 RepID=A0A7W7RII6_9ACTN|nr:TenA family protein [Lipingzhangella halophila]MBB4932661.1 thiaminase/transcriptional activator TenA [Lipingzhangella halophila]